MCYFEFICGNWCFSLLIKTWVDVQCSGLLFFSIAYLHSMCKQFHSFGSAAPGAFNRRCEYQTVFLTVSYMLQLFNDAPISLTPRSSGSMARSIIALQNHKLVYVSQSVQPYTLYVTQAWKVNSLKCNFW